MARQAQQGHASVWRLMKQIMLAGGAALLLFAVVYIVLRQDLVGLIYGTKYVAFTAAVFLVAFRPFLTLQKSMLTKALQAFRDTRSVFFGNVMGVFGGILLGGASILAFDLPASGAIVILSSLITIALFGWRWASHLSNEASWQGNLKQDPASMNTD